MGRRHIVTALLMLICMACSHNDSTKEGEATEDIEAKRSLAGIWVDDDMEDPFMRVEGDTIYYADEQSASLAFKIIRDTLFTYGNDTSYYKIDKQTEHLFSFHSLTGSVIALHKSEDPADSLYFVRRQDITIPTYTEVVKRDSIVIGNGTRYHTYEYINPTKMKVIKTVYSEEGISMDNVFYDNIIYVCVYQGKRSLFGYDINKQMFAEVVPPEFLRQAVLSDITLTEVNGDGFHYQAIIAIPESSVYSTATLLIDFEGKIQILP